MHRFILALSCILMMLAAPISAQDFQKGLEAAKSKNLNVDIEVPTEESRSMAEGIENYLNK